jgi:hypothetical protein
MEYLSFLLVTVVSLCVGYHWGSTDSDKRFRKQPYTIK